MPDVDEHQQVFGDESGDAYCPKHKATFHPSEAADNGDQCPWCGADVSEVVA